VEKYIKININYDDLKRYIYFKNIPLTNWVDQSGEQKHNKGYLLIQASSGACLYKK
jgi:hypothetical protein